MTGISIEAAKLPMSFSNKIIKFLHMYTSRIEDTNGLGVFTMDSRAHSPQTTSTVTAEFGAVIELRENDDGSRDIRIRGLPNIDRTWRSYS